LINASADVNPYLTLTEYLKASIFSKTNKLDSAFIYAQKAFNGKPRAKSNYEVLNEVCIKLNDTLTLKNAFHEYIKYRNEPWAWNKYLSIMMYLQQSPQQMKVIADSALLLFPNDPELLQKKNALTNSGEGMLISKEKDDEYRKYFAIGLEASINNNYTVAIENFKKAAAANPGDYVATENIGVCYFSLKQYSVAISYLDKVLQRKISTDGKSEYVKGACLLSLGKKDEACYYLNLANNKNYIAAAALLQSSCQ
jgi:tetratricopeptide (TPR) repeat protein